MKPLLALVLSTPVTSVAQATSLGTAKFTFTSINFPGATLTRGLGLNDHGDIVGDYIDSAACVTDICSAVGTFRALMLQDRSRRELLQ